MACAAALANLRIMEQDRLVENSEKMGTRLLEGLRGAVGKHPIVGEVRGRGLMVCVDFVQPDGSGKPLDRQAGGRARPQGVGPRGHHLRARHRAPPRPAALHHAGARSTSW